ncbi:MAG: OmpA family protein [Bradyrhizobium sp.]|nr:OmpA family protein [Bradyrhizobium sp.]
MRAGTLFWSGCLVAALAAAPALAQDYSTSIVRPTTLGDSGVISGTLPGGQGAKSYYLSLDLRPGTLLSQMKVTASSSGSRSITLDLLDSDATRKDSYYVKTSRNEQNEASRGFQIDSGGTYNLRVTVDGPEAGRFCVLLGGSALPNAKPAECPADPAVARQAASQPEPPPAAVAAAIPAPQSAPEIAAPVPPPPKTVEVVTTKCEQRLRVGSEVLFDFDRSAIRPQARPAIEYVAQTVQRAGKPVTIEGHTDSIGSDAYNMRLSELRAFTVQTELTRYLVSAVPMQARGFGKSRPIADNQFPDGTDNPDGRQRNRRVEIVLNTCM